MICCGPEEKKRIVAENGGRSDDSAWLPTTFGGSKFRHAPDSKIPKRWDVVLVYTGSVALTDEEQKLDVLERQKRESELNELAIRRKEAFAGLAAVGFKTHSFTEEAEEGKVPKSYTLISVPESLLRETAEAIGLEKRLKPGPHDPPDYTAYDEYTMLKHDMFLKDPYAEDGKLLHGRTARHTAHRIRALTLVAPPVHLSAAQHSSPRLSACSAFSTSSRRRSTRGRAALRSTSTGS